MSLHPHLKPQFNTVHMVMLDVIIALLPVLGAACWAYGTIPLWQAGIAITAALLTEFLYSTVLLKKPWSILDGSAIVTSMLLVFTLSPVTPWYVVAFGAFSAVLFGKIIFGGVGKNVFNPALVGRELMTVFFASVMTSPDIWKTADLVRNTTPDLFSGVISSPHAASYLKALIYKPGGAMGEYSIGCILLGGLYLLWRNRISWHIPFALLSSFAVLTWINGEETLRYSMAGILLGAVFMATDMPSSPTTRWGKSYYGMMIGTVIFIMIKGGVRFEYTSYSILLLNAFSQSISLQFRPRVWGEKMDRGQLIEGIFLLTLKILTGAFAVICLHRLGFIHYLVYIYIGYAIINYQLNTSRRISNAI